MRVLRNLAFYLAFYGGSVFIVLRAAVILVLGSETTFRRKVDDWARWHRFCMTRLLGIAVKIDGTFPPGPVLVALKHESFMEAIELPILLPNPAVFVKQELMRIPLWGLAARKYGLVEVARSQGARALRHMLASARELQGEGRSLMIFPEGTRVAHGQRPQLQAGFAGLYKLLGLPVVPVAVASGLVYNPLIKRPGTIRIVIGDPIEPGLPREEIEARVHVAINRLNQSIAA